METFHLEGDEKRLYFKNVTRRSDDEEFTEIVNILRQNKCEIGIPKIGPDCDLIKCVFQDVKFDLIRTIDGDGSFIYCDNPVGMRKNRILVWKGG